MIEDKAYHKAYHAAWYLKNREAKLAARRAYVAAHRDDPAFRAKAAECTRRWRAANPGRTKSNRLRLRGPIEDYYGEATYLTCPHCGVDGELIDLDTREYGPRGGFKGFLPLRCPACAVEVTPSSVWTKAIYKYDRERDYKRHRKWIEANPEKFKAASKRGIETRARRHEENRTRDGLKCR